MFLKKSSLQLSIRISNRYQTFICPCFARPGLSNYNQPRWSWKIRIRRQYNGLLYRCMFIPLDAQAFKAYRHPLHKSCHLYVSPKKLIAWGFHFEMEQMGPKSDQIRSNPYKSFCLRSRYFQCSPKLVLFWQINGSRKKILRPH